MLTQFKKSYPLKHLLRIANKIITTTHSKSQYLNTVNDRRQIYSFGNMLAQSCTYNFVNFPISSKYYHF